MTDEIQLAINQIRFAKAQIEKFADKDNEFWQGQIRFWEHSKAFWEAVSQFNGRAGLESVTPLPEHEPQSKKCVICGEVINRGFTCSDRCRKKLSRISNR